jgi:hypothetical protein
MKPITFFILALIAFSCMKSEQNSYYIKTAGRVGIKFAEIPETAKVNQDTVLRARAEESNGCWSNLNFVLTKESDFEYTLEAFGLFESTGYCEDILVYADTVIPFKPTITGTYIFQVLKNQTLTEADTMIVSDNLIRN